MGTIFLIQFVSLIIAIGLVVRFLAALFFQSSRAALGRHPLLHAGLLAFVIVVWFTPWCTAWGRLSAQADLRRGHFQIYRYGLVRIPLPLHSRILKERYNVHCPPISGCVVTMSEVQYKNAYNSVSMPAINRNFGKDIFEECRQAAEKEFQERHLKKDSR